MLPGGRSGDEPYRGEVGVNCSFKAILDEAPAQVADSVRVQVQPGRDRFIGVAVGHRQEG